MKKLLLFCLFMTLPTMTLAGEFPVIERSFFGVQLGESTQTLETKAKAAEIDINKQKWTFKGLVAPGKLWAIYGSLNKNKAIESTRFYIYNGQIYQIVLLLRDNSTTNFDALKTSLEKKYGKDTGGFMGAIETKADFTADFGGQTVLITLNRDFKFTEEGGSLSLMYTHSNILKAQSDELGRRKVKKFERDLLGGEE
jgi:hypothetical protein